MNYTIKISHKLTKTSESIDTEINNIAAKIGITLENYDMETSNFEDGYDIKTLGVIYEWSSDKAEIIMDFINLLPNEYKINNLQRQNNKDKYVIFSTDSKPDIKFFSNEDKNIYSLCLKNYKKHL